MSSTRVNYCISAILCFLASAYGVAAEHVHKHEAAHHSGSHLHEKAKDHRQQHGLDASGATNTNVKMIALSPDLATGIFLGFFLLGMLLFVIRMLASVQTSDTIGQPDKKEH